jgi:hypothetical protein
MGSATLTTGPPKDADMERRVAWLESQSKQLAADFARLQSVHREYVRSLECRIKQEVSALKTSISETQAEQEKLSVGDLDIEVVGLLWLMIGVIISSVPI